jgi:DNA primase catalytic core
MSLHKLTAGDGYTYLTRQVAAQDATERGHRSLGDYYSQHGEAPGVWAGRGLAGLVTVEPGSHVSEDQMKRLFGEGRHPDAPSVPDIPVEAGTATSPGPPVGALGRAFPVYATPADDLRARVARAFAAANRARGQPARSALALAERARIRTGLARDMFAAEHGRLPQDARELSGFLARASRPRTTAVAGYDLTFSPVKSVSALWALAPRAVSEQVEAAHRAAVADTLAWLEKYTSFTRTGAHGIRQVETRGLIAAVFQHRDSRAGDPDLHSHVAVSNKVQSPDGRWLALDGRVLHKAAVAASERYNTRLEAQLVERLGLRFAERDAPDGKRAVREIVGLDARLLSLWSTRRRVIDARRGELAVAFQRDHGRPPTAVESIALAQQATLQTRGAKHAPRSLQQQRTVWRREAERVLGGGAALIRMLDRVLVRHSVPQLEITDAWLVSAADRVVQTVSASRATWQAWHVRAEAERVVRAAAPAPADVDRAVARLTDRALSPAHAVRLGAEPIDEPLALRRSDGASVYTVAGAQLYTTAAVLDAEARLLAAAGRGDGRAPDARTVDLALLEAAANGRELNPGQVQLVRALALSGRRVQLAIAPAGTGKTTALATLARAWEAGGGRVLGLAPSAAATAELRSALDSPCDTLAKLVWSLDSGEPPGWVTGIGPSTLVVIDEAGMAGTVELARAVDHVLRRGGSVRLVGDVQQLAAVSAGGVLSELTATHGSVSLSQVVRFTDPAEAAATVALRAGDPGALGFYLDHHRIRVGDPATCADQAYAAWAADRARGLDSLLLAGTREVVTQLNLRARADRLAAHPAPHGPDVALGDGTRAGAGDIVLTRRNDRRLPITSTDWVKNGDRWTVRAVRADGALTVTHRATGRRTVLPPDYVRDHVELGYATTVHGAQGATADTCHTVLTGAETRQVLYVALSRGRAGNHLYLATAGDGDPHSVITPAAVCPPTATELLTAVLGRDGRQTSAATAQRTATDPATLLQTATARYADALRVAAESLLGPAALDELAITARRLDERLPDAPAWPTLRGHLALLAAAGGDPGTALREAAAARELDSALDPAAVLDWRLQAGGPAGPLPWLPGIPPRLAGDPQWGPYLAAQAARIRTQAALVADRAAAGPPAAAGDWARVLPAEDAPLRSRVAVWRASLGIAGNDRRPTGERRLTAAERFHQAALDAEVSRAVGTAKAATCWVALADSIDPRIRRDPYWPELADRLAAADRAGVDAAGLTAALGTRSPLPDDLPAAALWWRLAPHLGPAAVPTAAPPDAGGHPVRPEWWPVLAGMLPPGTADELPADPAWPALVAAVTTGLRAGWRADQLLAAVAVLPAATGPGAVCELLVFRTTALTDPAPVATPEPLPADLQPADDADLLPSPDVIDDTCPVVLADADWLAPMVEDAPAATEAHPWATPDPLATPDPRATGEPDVGDDADYLLEQHFWATAAVSRARLVALNERAAAFFTGHYAASWAPAYLRDRLGTDLRDDDRFRPGYAPAGWTALTDHLREYGATDAEIVSAGLGTRARTGRVIDRFRDRLTFPIRAADGTLVGFVARRHPDAEGDHAGPNYLNTPGTDLYRKGEHLFGLHEGRADLARGAAIALVEGPLDAIAVTLAGAGATVGAATLGTACTERQADLVSEHGPARGSATGGTLVATDNDPAGRQAAERVFWRLTARGDDPRHLRLPPGLDPADLLRTAGAAALTAALAAAPGLAEDLLADRLAPVGPDAAVAQVQRAVDATADLIAAVPPGRRLPLIDRVTGVLGLQPGVVHAAVLASSTSALPVQEAPHGVGRATPAGRRTPARPAPGARHAAPPRPRDAPGPSSLPR